MPPPPNELLDKNWRWTSLVEADSDNQFIVQNPSKYKMKLSSDGSLSLTADCNMVGGSYEIKGDKISITTGPSTLAFCGEQSLDTIFVESLTKVESFQLDGFRLVLYYADGVSEMTFSR